VIAALDVAPNHFDQFRRIGLRQRSGLSERSYRISEVGRGTTSAQKRLPVMQERVVEQQDVRSKSDQQWLIAVSVAFVLCWASGFVVPRVFIPYAEPLTFVALRNAAAALVLVVIAFALGAEWSRARRDILGLLWAGAFLQGFSLMGLYWAVYQSLPVGIAALIGGLQPALTAVFAMALIGERIGLLQWAGIFLGFLGLAVAVWPKVETGAASMLLLVAAVVGVACMAYASVFQKRFAKIGDSWTRTALMFVGASIPAAVGAMLFEHGQVTWNAPMIAVFVWSVFALAVGATMGLLFLIERGQASRAASLIYLVPPTSALMAYVGFGERVSVQQALGFVISACGVGLVQYRGGERASH
jgi:drug/metabolite transporter (DMT)-like permease